MCLLQNQPGQGVRAAAVVGQPEGGSPPQVHGEESTLLSAFCSLWRAQQDYGMLTSNHHHLMQRREQFGPKDTYDFCVCVVSLAYKPTECLHFINQASLKQKAKFVEQIKWFIFCKFLLKGPMCLLPVPGGDPDLQVEETLLDGLWHTIYIFLNDNYITESSLDAIKHVTSLSVEGGASAVVMREIKMQISHFTNQFTFFC